MSLQRPNVFPEPGTREYLFARAQMVQIVCGIITVSSFVTMLIRGFDYDAFGTVSMSGLFGFGLAGLLVGTCIAHAKKPKKV